MHSIKLEIKDNVLDKVLYFLQNLPKNEVKIIEEKKIDEQNSSLVQSEIKAYSDHSANLIKEWKETDEDAIWR